MSREMVTFYLQDALLGVDVGAVQEVLGGLVTTPVPLAPPSVAGLVNLRGEVILSVDLRARMGRPARAADQPRANVILRDEHHQVALVVDRIGEVVRVTDDQFEPSPLTLSDAARELITGAYKLEGQLLLVLDISSTLDIGYGIGTDLARTPEIQALQGEMS